LNTLKDRECIPCRGDTPPVSADERDRLLAQLEGWQVVDGHHLHKAFLFDDFASALIRINQIGEVAESQNHHPDLTLAWGRVGVEIWTHAIDGLTESDFILAAKIEALG
jgi:4a-hydroxytetrahydrobiopterin dehydratase